MAAVAALAALAMFSARAGVQAKLTLASPGRQVQLHFQGMQSNRVYEIEASTNLVNWTGIAQRAASNGTLTVTDLQAGKYSHRFYQAVAPTDLTGLGEDGYAPNKILVKPKLGVDLGGINLSLGVSVLHAFSAIGNLEVVKVPSSMTADTLIAQYLQSGLVQYAEPDFYVHSLAAPDDPDYPYLWGFHNTGQFGGVTNDDIDAPDAWAIQHDASNIIVAVVDTGVRYTHQDLAANMWHNPDENQDGYTNDLYGINVTTNGLGNGDPWDDYGHGTHVAGTIGAVGNNQMGVVGVAWHVQIMACKFLDSQGNGTIDGAIQCLDFARSHGANIVNASWGATSFTSQALHDAIASLRDAGIMFVAAAGNSGADNDVTPLYPASYSDLDNILAVAATDESDKLTSWSDYGATNVDLAAPGTLIYSCYNGSDTNYEYDDGTSMSCAMMSGAVAVMEAHFPGENYQQIKQQLMANVDPRPGLQGKCVSGGRVNLYKALAGGTPPPPTLAASFSANSTSGQAPLTVQFTDTSAGNPVSWNWNFGDGATDTAQNPSHTFNSAGNYTVTLTVANSSGQTSSASQVITATGATNSLPVLTVTAIQPDAYVNGPVSGTVNFHRTGDTSQAYEVYWSFSGTASNGVDYGPLPTNSPFPAGQSDATLTLTPINHGQTNDETVIVTLMPGSAYQIGASNRATIIIHGQQPGPAAGFTANPTSGQAPLTVQFTDTSTGSPVSWNWNFGDGSTSTTQNPSHTYASAGNFTATLTVANSSNQTSTASQVITVTNAPSSVTASFSANPTSGQAPLTVQFTDTSTGSPVSWNWNFGDGATSTAQNPSHTYASAGNFTATLTVANSSNQTSTASQVITVTNAPSSVTASFSANPSSGQAPLTVQFTDTSTGSPVSWNWNFGDGATSTAQNPSHTYASAGNFTATLTVTGSSGQTSSTSQTITVTNAPQPVTASFSANPSSGQAPLTVQFTDTSTGSPVSWNWNFGDGATSTAQNPSHTYASAGNFTATLTVTGSSGQTSSTSQPITVTNAPPPPPSATVTVTATQPLATSLTPGVFSISRSSSDVSSGLVVNYSLGGTAQNGVDYETLSGTVTIPAGSTTATVVVNPLGLLNVLKSVVLTISPEPAYTVGSPSSATVEIVASLTL